MTIPPGLSPALWTKLKLKGTEPIPESSSYCHCLLKSGNKHICCVLFPVLDAFLCFGAEVCTHDCSNDGAAFNSQSFLGFFFPVILTIGETLASECSLSSHRSFYDYKTNLKSFPPGTYSKQMLPIILFPQ